VARTGYIVDGARVGQARQEAGFTQTDLAARIGVHRVTMTKIENRAPVSLETLERLASALGRSREWLLGEPEQIDEFELAREKMASALESFSEAVDLLQRRIRDHAGDEVRA
jgi:transcriptional regulator with XRE-family HTH domain